MINFLAKILGGVLRVVYQFISGLGSEPELVSFYGLAIIITTIIFKIIIIPLSLAQVRNQKKMALLQPEVEKIQKKYNYDQQTLALKTQELYRKHNYSPMAGCLPLLVQFPIIISFYRIFQFPERFAFTNPEFFASMQKNFFHIPDLGNPDHTLIFPLLAAGATYLSTEISQRMQDQQNPAAAQANQMMSTMKIMMPIMIFFFARNMPAGLVIYWITSSVFTIVQQIISKQVVKRDVEKAKQEAESR